MPGSSATQNRVEMAKIRTELAALKRSIVGLQSDFNLKQKRYEAAELRVETALQDLAAPLDSSSATKTS
jgi:hypothetical protein